MEATCQIEAKYSGDDRWHYYGTLDAIDQADKLIQLLKTKRPGVVDARVRKVYEIEVLYSVGDKKWHYYATLDSPAEAQYWLDHIKITYPGKVIDARVRPSSETANV